MFATNIMYYLDFFNSDRYKTIVANIKYRLGYTCRKKSYNVLLYIRAIAF